jgi:hypothetical protein
MDTLLLYNCVGYMQLLYALLMILTERFLVWWQRLKEICRHVIILLKSRETFSS